jgi:hypothetical protein
MKRMLETFYCIPWRGVLVALVISLFASCMEEPFTKSSDGLTRSAAIDDQELPAESLNAQQTFSAHLTGDQERPNPITTRGSGQAIFKLSKDGMSLSYKVIVNNLKNVTQAHIHCGNSEVAGPVVAFLFGFVAEGVTVNGVLAEGVITNADIIARPDTQLCMGGVANFEQLVAKLKSGEAYINVHTVGNPPGEIRGQIK